MKVLHTSFECYPLSKVGGLADVVGALPKYLNDLGCETEVITPLYNKKAIESLEPERVFSGTIILGDSEVDFEIKKLDSTHLGFPVYLVHIDELLFRENVYGYQDDTERFVSFQLAVLEWVVSRDTFPDIIHCHDHHTGLIPFLISEVHRFDVLSKIPTVITIHNAQYQGQFSYEKLDYIPEFTFQNAGLLDWNHTINPLAAAIKSAWKVTTVSPSYMVELQMAANGLETLLASEQQKCIGILNGIDWEVWDPKTDPMLLKNYDGRSLFAGRKEHKNWLCKSYNLDPEKPLFAFIGRLVHEKGADLLPDIVQKVLETEDCNIFILGSGDPFVENQLHHLKKQFSGNYNAYIGYDEKLSHIIYAGADFLLMPSRVEPCGLNQMYALRYGTIPIVRRIGGLKDTVTDIGDDGFGICHDQASIHDIAYSIGRAMTLYQDQNEFRGIQKKILKIDNSWNNSAKQYIELYESLKLLTHD